MTTEGNRLPRQRLPDTRSGKTHRVVIEDVGGGGELDLYIRTGEYEDGRLGEVFITVSKQGSSLQGLLDGWAQMMSIALQYDVPLDVIAEKFIDTSFPPAGTTSDETSCSSLFDCVMKWLTKEYVVNSRSVA